MHRTVLALGILGSLSVAPSCRDREPIPESRRVEIDSDNWKLVGDVIVPESHDPVPAVLMLNKAAGNRTAYAQLANDLAARGVASLRLDLRGHGESVNLGTFMPGEEGRKLIERSDVDVATAQRYLQSLPAIDRSRIAVVGASYSGEAMMVAARESGFAKAYVALSPGSLSDESILALDAARIPWLYVASRSERHLQEVTAAVLQTSQTAEVVLSPGTEHATDILASRPDVTERIAVWLATTLNP